MTATTPFLDCRHEKRKALLRLQQWETCRKAEQECGDVPCRARTAERINMASVQLKNIKKVYPYISGEDKKKQEKEPDSREEINHQITDEGVVAVQQFSLDIRTRSSSCW